VGSLRRRSKLRLIFTDSGYHYKSYSVEATGVQYFMMRKNMIICLRKSCLKFLMEGKLEHVIVIKLIKEESLKVFGSGGQFLKEKSVILN